MAVLHVRNFPDELYMKLRVRATENRRSLSAEVINFFEEKQKMIEKEEALMDQIDILAVREALADYEINGGTPWETVMAEMKQENDEVK